MVVVINNDILLLMMMTCAAATLLHILHYTTSYNTQQRLEVGVCGTTPPKTPFSVMDLRRSISHFFKGMKTTRNHSENMPSVERIARDFEETPHSAWEDFVNLNSWSDREAVVDSFSRKSRGWEAYLHSYRQAMRPYIRDDFYDIFKSTDKMEFWKNKYEVDGEINVDFLKYECLEGLSKYADTVEPTGKDRYNTQRPTYPPGEVLNFKQQDPRKHIMTQVNMTAVSCSRMNENDAVQWIYHSPHLRLFLAHVMECHRLYPYLSDLGLAINIMRPAKSAQTALGFHFDSIDSSRSKNGEGAQPKGATGVIGIQDCDEGGERIVFPTVHRNNVESVDMILKKYDPLRPGKIIGPLKPSVFRQATRGMLYLFNGGNVLHGVSSVRKGSRIAAVFMFQEERPNESKESEASSDFFYGKKSVVNAGQCKL